MKKTEKQNDQNLITEQWPNELPRKVIRDCDKEEEILDALRPNPWKWPHMYVSEHPDRTHPLEATEQQTIDAVFNLALKFKKSAERAKAEGNPIAYEENMNEYRNLLNQIRNEEIY